MFALYHHDPGLEWKVFCIYCKSTDVFMPLIGWHHPPSPHFQPSVGFSQNVFVSHYRENQEFHNHNLSSSLEVDVRLAVNQWSLSLIWWSSLKPLQSVTNAADTFPVAPIISQPNRWKSTCLCQLSLVEFSSYLYILLMFVYLFIYFTRNRWCFRNGKMQKSVFSNYLAFLKHVVNKKLISLGCLTLTVHLYIRPLFSPSSADEGKFLQARLTRQHTDFCDITADLETNSSTSNTQTMRTDFLVK